MRKISFLAIIVLMILAQTTNSFAVSTTSRSTSNESVPETPAVTSISDAMKEFKSLSRQERRERIKEVKKEIKQFKKDKKSGAEPSTNTLLLVILALLLPPLAVYLHQGEINSKFWISLLLTLLFFIPGVIYALIVVLGDEA